MVLKTQVLLSLVWCEYNSLFLYLSIAYVAKEFVNENDRIQMMTESLISVWCEYNWGKKEKRKLL